jgi:hypothetical protein
VSMARLAWAAATIGTTPYGPRSQRPAYGLELQWREAMMRASIAPDRQHHWRSDSYARLDPAEKGAVSFFLGQAQAKLFAHDFFRVSRFVHFDFYLEHYGQPRSRMRPDFIGFHGRYTAIAVEAKGRSLGYDPAVVNRAKDQVRSLPNIKGYNPSTTYVHLAYFYNNEWCARLEDPPQVQSSQDIDSSALNLAYYLPIVYAIRAGQEEPERVRIWGGVSYVRRHFDQIDLSLSVREDIAALVPTEDETAASYGTEFNTLGMPLFDRILSLDEEDVMAKPLLPEQDNERSFLGPDGVAVELGPSWIDWRISETRQFPRPSALLRAVVPLWVTGTRIFSKSIQHWSSLGYEQYDGYLRRPGPPPVVTLTSANGMRAVSVALARLPRLGASRRVSFTNQLTNTALPCCFPPLRRDAAGAIKRRGDGTTGPPTGTTHGDPTRFPDGKPTRSAGREASEPRKRRGSIDLDSVLHQYLLPRSLNICDSSMSAFWAAPITVSTPLTPVK